MDLKTRDTLGNLGIYLQGNECPLNLEFKFLKITHKKIIC